MAVATITRVPNSENVYGKHRSIMVDVVGPSTYAANGIPIAATYLGGKVILAATVNAINAPASRLLAYYDPVVGALRVSYPTGGATASPGALADPISTSGAATASAVDAVTPNITPGRGKEVAANTDLSTCSWRVKLEGY